ncbi:MAG TPA: DUF4405 domain-containing protein [Syntrophomonadaceae bacterium]|nr:DUF4405 domain-containing protein [Syntrophomonadaceae bacterium]HOQ10445.1 DUF4405 domain-containing protein [Syntrophomonadaceae bacterium]HPU49596.1 DUF4405 domain-containing protein [Syntrophomonadaceae bacterium]
MSKAKTNLVIDGIMFLTVMALLGTGYVRKYVLLSGSASRQLYGTKVHMYLLGINRDGWATIHLYLGYFLLALVLLHIVVHWKQVKAIFKNLIPHPKWRPLFIFLFISLSLFLALFPFLITPTLWK